MPKVVVDDYGGKRTDPGMLGHGIYFASSARCVFQQLSEQKYHREDLKILLSSWQYFCVEVYYHVCCEIKKG